MLGSCYTAIGISGYWANGSNLDNGVGRSCRPESSVAAGQRKNLFRRHAHGGPTAQLGEFAGQSRCDRFRGAQRDLTVVETLKGDPRARLQAEIVPDFFGNRNLPFACEISCHESITYKFRVIP
jgi:hypothetical protein